MQRRSVLMLIGFAIEAVALGLLAALGPLRHAVDQMLALAAAAGAGYLAACLALDDLPRLSRRGALGLWVLFIAVRAVLLVGTEPLSDDVVPYQWHGYVQAHGYNPYDRPPADPAYRALRQGFPYREVPHAQVRPPYPPLAQLVFRWVWPIGLGALGMRLLFTLFDLACAAVLWNLAARRTGRGERALWYLANPLVIFVFACDGHLDSMAMFGLVSALWLLDRGWARSALVAIGAGIAAKVAPVLVVPYWVRRSGWRYAWLVLVVPVVSAVPFASAGVKLVDGLAHFARTGEFNGSLYSIARWLFSHDKLHALVLLGTILGLVLLVLWWRRVDPERATLATLLALCLVSRIVHPWYIVWLVLFLPLVRCWPAILWSLTALATYHIYGAYDPAVPGSWRESAWILWAEYVPVYAALAWSMWTWARGPGAPAGHTRATAT